MTTPEEIGLTVQVVSVADASRLFHLDDEQWKWLKGCENEVDAVMRDKYPEWTDRSLTWKTKPDEMKRYAVLLLRERVLPHINGPSQEALDSFLVYRMSVKQQKYYHSQRTDKGSFTTREPPSESTVDRPGTGSDESQGQVGGRRAASQSTLDDMSSQVDSSSTGVPSRIPSSRIVTLPYNRAKRRIVEEQMTDDEDEDMTSDADMPLNSSTTAFMQALESRDVEIQSHLKEIANFKAATIALESQLRDAREHASMQQTVIRSKTQSEKSSLSRLHALETEREKLVAEGEEKDRKLSEAQVKIGDGGDANSRMWQQLQDVLEENDLLKKAKEEVELNLKKSNAKTRVSTLQGEDMRAQAELQTKKVLKLEEENQVLGNQMNIARRLNNILLARLNECELEEVKHDLMEHEDHAAASKLISIVDKTVSIFEEEA